MSLNACINNIRKFLNTPAADEYAGMFRITVAEFEDRSNLNCGLRFAELLKRNRLFDVKFCDENFSKTFLNLQGRNFFDFTDQGKRILEQFHSDILIWGYEENGKIRLNFQTPAQYIPSDVFFSMLDSLFVPLKYFSDTENFSASMMLLIHGVIISAITPVTNVQKQSRRDLLGDIINLLSKDNAPKDLSREFMPFIMNMLAKIYLQYIQNKFDENDIKIIENLLNGALKNKQYLSLPIYFGCVHNSFGQLYETAFKRSDNNNFIYLKDAIKHYRAAQRYITRSYPYDYGLISYRLAELYFEFWKYTDDLQALRDAVSYLREAEKVYTQSLFAALWGKLQGLLGYYLTCLGLKAQSNDIMLLAINSYHNQQKIYPQTMFPQEWADIQDEIGNIYYLLGKQNNDDNFMYEARNYFLSAMDVYTQTKNKAAAQKIKQRLAKLKNYID